MKTMGFFDEVKSNNVMAVKHFETGDVTCPVIVMCGAPASGKTTIAISPVCDLAAPILYRLVEGVESCHTQVDRLYVFTGKDTDHMEVRVKLKDKKALVDTLYDLVLDGIRNRICSDGVSDVEAYPDSYCDIMPYVPDRYFTTFLFFIRVCGEHNFGLYNVEHALQMCDDYDSHSFLGDFISLIEDGLHRYIEDGVEHIYAQFNDILGSRISTDTITVDIDLNNPDKEKVDFLFHCHTQDGSGFEIICDLVTVYVPMNEQVKKCALKNSVYRDADGEVSFAFLDTKGLYKDTQVDEVMTRLLLLRSKYDAITFITPPFPDTFHLSVLQGILEALEHFIWFTEEGDVKGLPIFFLYSKVDYPLDIKQLVMLGLSATEDGEKRVRGLIEDMWSKVVSGVAADSFPHFMFYADRFCNETSDLGQGKTKYAFSNVIRDFLTSVAETIRRW